MKRFRLNRLISRKHEILAIKPQYDNNLHDFPDVERFTTRPCRLRGPNMFHYNGSKNATRLRTSNGKICKIKYRIFYNTIIKLFKIAKRVCAEPRRPPRPVHEYLHHFVVCRANDLPLEMNFFVISTDTTSSNALCAGERIGEKIRN